MKTEKSRLFNAKYLVITGYVLVMVVMIAGILSIYNNLVDFSEKKVRDENLTELIIVGNTISQLYNIESSQGLFNYEGARLYFHKYDSVLPTIYANLDTLKSLSKESSREIKLDSIKLLIEQKNRNLQNVVVLLDSIEKSPRITRETTSRFVPRKLNSEITDYLEKKNLKASPLQSKTDTTVIHKEQKGFFARVRDVFAGGRPDSTVVIEKQSMLEEKEFKLLVDTIVNMVRYAERLNLENQRKFQYILLSKQADMSNTNNLLTMRIDELLKSIEKEEFDKSVRLLEDKKTTLLKSQKTIYGVLWLGLAIALVFGILFIIAFNIGQKYRKRLEVSNERIQNLLASREKLMLSISHDIKAPMASILGYIELMYPGILNDKEKVYLDNMKNSGEHVLHLVMNLLDYHKLESGVWTHRKMNFNVKDFVNDSLESFRPIAENKKLNYTIKNAVSPDLVSYGDPYMLRQIMSNLVSNAIKYTPKGSVSTNVVALGDGPDLSLKFSVTDTGKGIEEKDQKIIFHEFEQLKVSESESGIEGSGLGLAITKALVEELNGSVSLQSEKGKGSVFTVTVPLAQPCDMAEMDTSSTDKNYVLDNLNVLLVDDDPIQLTMTSEMLRLKRINVVTENNPENVLNILRHKVFDIVFIDIQMPYMNGFTLVRNIRKSDIKGIANLPIVALSAKSDICKPDVENAGFTDFLTKPFSASGLYATIGKYVESCLTGNTQAALNVSPKGVEALIDFVKEDKQTSLEIVKLFTEEISANICKMEEAFAIENKMVAGQIAHKIVPLIQMLGDEKLVDLLRKIEHEGSVSPEEKKQTLSSLRKHVKDAQYLQTILEKSV